MNISVKLLISSLILTLGVVNTSQAQSTTAPSKSEEEKELKQNPAKKPSPHSHVQEKTGIPQTAPKELSAEEKAKNKKLHSHQRDAK